MDDDNTGFDDGGFSSERVLAEKLKDYLSRILSTGSGAASVSCRVVRTVAGGCRIECDLRSSENLLAANIATIRKELRVIESDDAGDGHVLTIAIPEIWSETKLSSVQLFTTRILIAEEHGSAPKHDGISRSHEQDANYGRPREDYDHVIVLVHGIRDIGAWQNKVSRGLEEPGTTVKQVRFGLYPATRFLFPINLSAAAVRKVKESLNDLKYEYRNARISVIAHSFGTYVVLKALEQDPNIQLWKLVFCGSVANDQLRWSELKRRVGDQIRPTSDFIINDCGTGDSWPVLGSAFGWHYGMAGATGFSEGFVTNRFHRAKGDKSGGHGLYFDLDFVRQKWRPFLIDDVEPAPGDGEQGEHLPWLVRLLYHGWARWICRILALVLWLALIAGTAGAIWFLGRWGLRAVELIK